MDLRCRNFEMAVGFAKGEGLMVSFLITVIHDLLFTIHDDRSLFTIHDDRSLFTIHDDRSLFTILDNFFIFSAKRPK